MSRFEDSSFLIVANGTADSPPASGVRDFLAQRSAQLTAIFHPLNVGDPPVHHVQRFERGALVEEKSVSRPSHPPLTYSVDFLSPFLRPRVDVWIGFSNLSVLHGLGRRRVGLTTKVVYWAVDFVPDRFGTGSPLTRIYDRVDAIAATNADLRVELTTAARDARSARLRLDDRMAPSEVAPVGIWLDRIEQAPEDGWRTRRVVFIGHLVARQGVAKLIEAVAQVPDVTLQIAGRGPEEAALRDLVNRLAVGERVEFVGFLSDHRDVERLVAGAAIAAAPYATDMESFTRYADPSKLRTYTGAGLPVVTTNVPPNAAELEREAGASVVAYDAAAIASAIIAILSSPEEWQGRRAKALEYARGFDWGRIVPAALAPLGLIS
jgi:glycosyltransferase involved in cell wall biosynthesis